MSKKYLLVLLLMTPFFLFANEKPDFSYTNNDQFCLKAGVIGEKFMQIRQDGNSIGRALELAALLSNGNAEAYNVFKKMAISAYSEKIKEDKKSSEIVFREFSNSITIDCIKEIENDLDIKSYKKDDVSKDWFNNKENNEEIEQFDQKNNS